MEKIKALSVLDGRYGKAVEDLREIFSEYGLIKHRVIVEVRWLKYMIAELKLAKVEEGALSKINPLPQISMWRVPSE